MTHRCVVWIIKVGSIERERFNQKVKTENIPGTHALPEKDNGE